MFGNRQVTEIMVPDKCRFVVAVPLLSFLAGTCLGGFREYHTGHQHETFSRQLKDHNTKGQGPFFDFAFRKHDMYKNTAAGYNRHDNLLDVLNDHFEGFGGTVLNLQGKHGVNHHRNHKLGFKPSKGHHRRVWASMTPTELDQKLRKRRRQEIRLRRSSPPKDPMEVSFGGIRIPQGITYIWTRDVGAGRPFNEAAFKSKDKNVVLILSFDDTLKDANLTASATLYDFTGATGVMAIKPRLRPGPCFLVETSLTYDKIIADLDARNGSSVSTSTVISLDGTGNPLSREERQALLENTPSLSRQCRRREVIRTKRIGFPMIPSDRQTSELKLLALDAELAIVVPTELYLQVGPLAHFIQHRLKGPGRVKGQGILKGQ